ncbi:hypothetical protein JCM10908_001990 [Rhodotorula pacifica]|uniref:uncharacterized protein n=1 Tax=Rhodotorula pacifica TaxID=1495444 RepID=UPI003171DD14
MLLRRTADELGINHLRNATSPRDVALLLASRFVRMLGFGAIAPILVLYFELLRFSARKIGLFLSLTLLGDVAVSLLVAWTADRIGRRKMLALGSAAMAGSGLAFVLTENYAILLMSATLGVVSPSGNEVGPFSSLETAMLGQLAPATDRVFVSFGARPRKILSLRVVTYNQATQLLMYYQLLGFIGLAVGSVSSGLLIGHLQNHTSTLLAYRAIFSAYALIGLIKVSLSACLTAATELEKPALRAATLSASEADSMNERQPLLPTRPALHSAHASPHVKSPVSPFDQTFPELPRPPPPPLPLCRLALVVALFAVDAFASSLTPASYVALYLQRLHHASIETITTVLAGAALSAVVFSLGTGALSKRVGLVLAMVTTHIPAQLITCGLAFARTSATAISLYIARTSLSSMDSSIRGALLSAMVRPEARTRLLGIVNVSRTLVATPGPFVTGRLVEIGALKWTFMISGGIKILCDIGLLLGFRSAKLEH